MIIEDGGKPTKAELTEHFARVKRACQREDEALSLESLAWLEEDADHAAKAKRLRAKAAKLRSLGGNP